MRELLQGYYASVSYVDDLVGKLLAELDRLNLRENTIVILWGDHGFKLSEHGEWGKHANFEVDVRSPLIISVPGMEQAGKTVSALTEFVDVYPTLVELCGLQAPAHLEGRSLLPVLMGEDSRHREFAFGQWPRSDSVMGFTVRLDSFRYTQWQDRQSGEILARELYDHRRDPGENQNVATDPAHAASVAMGERLIASKLAQIRIERGE